MLKFLGSVIVITGVQVCSSDSTASSQSSMSYEDSLSAPSKSVRHPMPPSSDTCWRWLRGWCQRGYDCRFVHGDLDYDVQVGYKLFIFILR
jgi:hypothetical protein